jgi:hypothetical protein
MSTPFGIRLIHVFSAVALLAVALVPHVTYAALGEPDATVADDAQQLQGSIKSTQRASFRVHEIQLPSGTVLREFAAPGGTVFAVAWSGPTIPNLRQILGRYFDAYVSAAQENRSGHHHLQIRQNEWVMESNGHMRAFTGRAYLPQGLPPGMSLNEIR